MAITGPFYSLTQLEELWLSAGGTPQSAATAAAVAYAESSGGQTSTNVNTNGTTDYGLWQINSAHYAENPSLYDPTKLTADPTYNANAAIMLAGGTKPNPDFSPWATYTTTDPTHSYTRFLAQAQAALPTAQASSSSSSAGWWKYYLTGQGTAPDWFHPSSTPQAPSSGSGAQAAASVPWVAQLFGIDAEHWSTAIALFVVVVLLIVAYALFTHSGSDETPQPVPVPVPV